MCGIVGCNFKKDLSEVLKLTTYRGPDNSQYNVFGKFTLGHNRLAIIDLDAKANQPFVSVCKNFVIVFNGEIYNYLEIRKTLENKYKFITHSDTEVLLYSYIEYGESCLDKLNGMFSFAIYDIKNDKLFCARDRLGVKPFIYYYDGIKLIFASEIKSILAILDKKPEIKNEALMQYLHYLYVPYPNTMFENINKLPPGHSMVFQKGILSINKYWDVSNYIGLNIKMGEEECLYALDRLLNSSVKYRMIADVELGSFLSGGIDSSTILYYMAMNSNKPINTYTLSFPSAGNYDESSDARKVAKHFNTNHREIAISPNIAELLSKMVGHFDEPFGNPTSLLIHELTKETKKFATVALAGDGGDEIFGGYPRYEAIILANKVKYIPKTFFQLLAVVTNMFPEDTSGNHKLRRIKTFINSLSKEEAKMYESWVSYFSDEELIYLMKNNYKFSHIALNEWDKLSTNNIIKSSVVDLKTFLPNNLLAYGDAMSMANSFEVRFPLTDYRLIEFMTSINPAFRIKNGNTKYLIKKLLKGKVPEEIINKPKLGLNPPMGTWLKKDLKYLVESYLSKEVVEKRGILNHDFIQKILNEHASNKRDRSLYIWSLIVLEEWFRQYID